jgi:mevalonate kinase
MRAVLDLNEAQVKRVTVALKNGDEAELLDALRVGERTLETMGVVSTKVIPLLRAIEKEGGAAKILGGGGKADGVGFLLCYHHDFKRVAALSKEYRYTIQPIILGGEGIRLEER